MMEGLLKRLEECSSGNLLDSDRLQTLSILLLEIDSYLKENRDKLDPAKLEELQAYYEAKLEAFKDK